MKSSVSWLVKTADSLNAVDSIIHRTLSLPAYAAGTQTACITSFLKMATQYGSAKLPSCR